MDMVKPDKTSADYDTMLNSYTKARDIMLGVNAVKKGGEKYLPKFPSETKSDYKFRLDNAKFTNVYRDIVENLAARPFEEELHLDENTSSPNFETFVENVDGRGNHLHQFAQGFFCDGIAKGINWILVDYTRNISPNATIAQEKAIGARPFWVSIDPLDLIAVYSDFDNGNEVITHARIIEKSIAREGFKEQVSERVRVFNREKLENGTYGAATWELWLKKQQNSYSYEWILEDAGVITIGIIPLVPFWAGRRIGSSFTIIPTLQDALDLQIELYQEETKLKSIKDATAFPMLTANNIMPPLDKAGKPIPISTGAKSVLYAPPNADGGAASWAYLEPQSQSLEFLAKDIQNTKQDLRELGRQPLTAQTGNLTVVTTAFAAKKGNAAISVWALNIKDALENALKITAMWFKENIEPVVCIKSDFDAEIGGDNSPTYLLQMRSSGDLSLETLWGELKRRGILSPDFNHNEELQQILNGEVAIDLVNGVDTALSNGLDSPNAEGEV